MNTLQRYTMLTMLGPHWVLWLLMALSMVALGVVITRDVRVLTARDPLGPVRQWVSGLFRGQRVERKL